MLSNTTVSAKTGQPSQNIWDERSAEQRFAKKEWKKGLALTAHQSVNKIAFADQYYKNQAEWDKMFTFLRETDLLSIEPGNYTIDGDHVYAIITEAPSKTFETSAWESHRKYIDLQYVITGKEKIGLVQLASAIITKPYDDAKDYALYSGKGKYYTAKPGTFFLFFPDDVHRPNIKVQGFDIVKKLVVKIRVVE
ncbi:MAG: YhcH/YjgK/YiaL family protein [Sphingobacteriales bacterium]